MARLTMHIVVVCSGIQLELTDHQTVGEKGVCTRENHIVVTILNPAIIEKKYVHVYYTSQSLL